MKYFYKYRFACLTFFLIIFSVSFISCDKGIEPYREETEADLTSFEGKVTFIGTWPEGVMRTYIVVFSEPSRFDVSTLNFIIGPIPYNSTEFIYNSIENNLGLIPTLNPGEYPYIIVAQSKTPELSLSRKDWTVAGVYYLDGDTTNPGKVKIEKGKVTTGINIICDFNNPPVQPPSIWILKNE